MPDAPLGQSAQAQRLRDRSRQLEELSFVAHDSGRFAARDRLLHEVVRLRNLAARIESRKDRFPLDRAYAKAWSRITSPPQIACPKRPQKFARPVRFVRPTPRECRPAARRRGPPRAAPARLSEDPDPPDPPGVPA